MLTIVVNDSFDDQFSLGVGDLSSDLARVVLPRLN
jgi:hypothetical protein